MTHVAETILTVDEIKKEIQDQKAEIVLRKTAWEQAIRDNDLLHEILFHKQFGVAIGTELMVRFRGGAEELCKVVGYCHDMQWMRKPWFWVVKKLKSGEWSKSQQYSYDDWRLAAAPMAESKDEPS